MTWCRDGPVLAWLSKSLSWPQLPCQLAAGGTPASTSPSRTFSWVLPILPVIVVEKNQTKQQNSWLTLARSMLFSPRVYLSFAAPGVGRRILLGGARRGHAGGWGQMPTVALQPSRAVCGRSPGQGACRRVTGQRGRTCSLWAGFTTQAQHQGCLFGFVSR